MYDPYDSPTYDSANNFNEPGKQIEAIAEVETDPYGYTTPALDEDEEDDTGLSGELEEDDTYHGCDGDDFDPYYGVETFRDRRLDQ